MNISRCLKCTTCGVSKQPMVALYRPLIQSVTDYAMEVYFDPSTQKQKQALRICTGAIKSTPRSMFTARMQQITSPFTVHSSLFKL